MKTIKAIIHTNSPVYKDLFRVYNSCLRYAYNRLVDNGGEVKSDLRNDLYGKFLLNKRYLQDVTGQAYLRYCFHKSQEKKSGSGICFGTAECFRQYNNGEISKDELKDRRNHIIWSSGERYCGGNTNHKISKDELGQHWIRSTLLRDKGRDKKSYGSSKSDKSLLFIPKEFREEFDQQEIWMITILNTWTEKGHYEVRITYNDNIDYLNHPNIISIDLNHNTLDYSVIVSKIRVKTDKIILNLSGKKESKQQALIDIIKKQLIPLAFKYKAHFVIENLSYFKNEKKSIGSKKARKKIGDIPRQMFMDLMVSIPKKRRIKTDLVNPKYTSFIATQKYDNEFENKDQGASYVIGRKKILGKFYRTSNNYDFYEKLPKNLKIQALFIAILYNVKRLFTDEFDKIKYRFSNQSLWWYLYHISPKQLSNLKDSLGDVNIESSCDGSIGLVDLVLRQVESLVTLTESDSDFKSLYEFLRNLSIRLREIRRDYTLNTSTGASYDQKLYEVMVSL